MSTSSVERVPLELRAALTAGGDEIGMTAAVPELGVEAFRMQDGPIGVTNGRIDERAVGILTPCPTAQAASWDRQVVQRIGKLIGGEARRMGVDVIHAPNLNLPRSPNGGRAFEQFSEDPYLTAEMGVAWLTGVQSTGIGACPKHLVGNDSETNRHSMSSIIDERALHEVYLIPFESAAAAGAWMIMTAYNRLNGTWTSEHAGLLRDTVRDLWGFDGPTVSDWFGTHGTLGSAIGGLDLEMPGPARFFGAPLAELVRTGEIGEAEIDVRLDRMARIAHRASEARRKPVEPRDGTEKELLTEAAAAGFVLVRNDRNILPLKTSNKLAVVGPNAAKPCLQGGTFGRINLEPGTVTPIEAISSQFDSVVHESGAVADIPIPAIKPLNPRSTASKHGGLHVEYVTPAGETVQQETRDTNVLVWFYEMPGLGPIESMPVGARVRFSATITAPVTGDYEFVVAGTGGITLSVDGNVVVDGGSRAASGDVMGALLHGEISSGNVFLESEQSATLTVEMELGQGRAQGLRFGVHLPVPDNLEDLAVEAAKNAEAVVAIVGESADASLESADRKTTHLPVAQEALVRRVIEANPNTVVVINAAHAVDIDCADGAAAVVFVWYPGQEFGPALADVLSGKREPGGRMPVFVATDESHYPAFDLTPDSDSNLSYDESILIGQRSLDAAGLKPAVAIGHGLGYTEHRIDGFEVDHENPDAITGRAQVTNIGSRPGKAVVQIYAAPPAGPVNRPVQTLAGFEAVWLEAGEQQTVEIPVIPRSLQRFVPDDRHWVRDPGLYEFRAGWSSRDIRQVRRLELN